MTGRRNTLRSVMTSSGSPHLAATSERVLPSVMSLLPQRMVANAGEAASSPRTAMTAARFMVRR